MKTKHKSVFRKTLINPLRLLSILVMAVFTSLSCSTNEEIDMPSETTLAGRKAEAPGTPQLLTSLPTIAMGSTIGPGGDLYVTQGAAGSILRIDKHTGDVTTFTSGLPISVLPIGGVIDVAFIGGTAYALVTLVGPFFGEADVVSGIYRIEGPDSYTVIADIGQFAFDNEPSGFDYVISTGLQFSMEVYQGGFLVSDGHHNRVYQVTLDGAISEFKTFDNVVPTGLAVKGNTVYLAETGTTDQFYGNSKVVSFDSNSQDIFEVASGVPFLVDVEFNRGNALFAISQGEWAGGADGDAAEPNTGSLLRVNSDGTFTTIVDELDRPTSLEFIQNTAYIVTLTGQIWTVNNVAEAPFGS